MAKKKATKKTMGRIFRGSGWVNVPVESREYKEAKKKGRAK